MNVSTTIPATIQIRRSRLVGLIGGAAAVAAAVTWALMAFAVDADSTAKSSVATRPTGLTSLTTGEQRALDMVMALTPAQLRGIRWYFGAGQIAAKQQEQAARVGAPVTPAQLGSIRWFAGAAAVYPPAAKQQEQAAKVGAPVTPAQLGSIRWFGGAAAQYPLTPPRTRLTASEQRALDLVMALTPVQLKGVRYYWTPPAAS